MILEYSPPIYTQIIAKLRTFKINNLGEIIEKLLRRDREMNIAEKLQKIDTLKDWLDDFRPLPAAVVTELRKRYIVRLTYHSNAIEGNTLTQSETELILEKGITIGGKTLVEHLEVIGHREAIYYIESLAWQDNAIAEWEIKQIHNLILRKIDPESAGRYRQLDVKAAGTDYRYPPHYLLPELMSDFVSWLNSEDSRTLHPLVYATEAHYRFVSIHPFQDGNGRTGRLLLNLLLLQKGYPIVIISNPIRKQYIDALAFGQNHENDLTQLLDIIIDSAQTSLIEVLEILATVPENQDKDCSFYQSLLAFLQENFPES